MNLHNLKYFLMVAEEKNITKAAQKLFISQQTLSGAICPSASHPPAPACCYLIFCRFSRPGIPASSFPCRWKAITD